MKLLAPWYELKGDILRFRFNSEAYSASREAAKVCLKFVPDDEDEQTDEVSISCFNCMKRRWLLEGLECIQLRKRT